MTTENKEIDLKKIVEIVTPFADGVTTRPKPLWAKR